jgi:hypothetical protein
MNISTNFTFECFNRTICTQQSSIREFSDAKHLLQIQKKMQNDPYNEKETDV